MPTAAAPASQRRAAPSSTDAAADRPHAGALPPLLQKILADYSATGLPPAYLPQRTTHQEEGTS